MKDYAKQLIKENTIFDTISRQEEVFWLNDKYLPFDMIDGWHHRIAFAGDSGNAGSIA